MSNIFIPKDPIETAQEFQWDISIADPEEAPNMAHAASPLIRVYEQKYDEQQLRLHVLGAYTLDVEGLKQNKPIKEEIEEAVIEGQYVNLEYIQTLDDPKLQTFMVFLQNAKLLEPLLPAYPNGEIEAPLIIPVLKVLNIKKAA